MVDCRDSSAASVSLAAGETLASSRTRQLLHDYVGLSHGDCVGLNLDNSTVGRYLIPLGSRAVIRTLAVVRRGAAAEQFRQLGADVVLVDGDDLTDRASAALDGVSLGLLLEGTGDPAKVDKLVGLVEDNGSVVAFSLRDRSGARHSGAGPDRIYRGISLRVFYILNWLRDTPRERLAEIYGELAELVAQGVMGAEVEAAHGFDQFSVALTHAQRAERSGKVLVTPAVQTA